MWFVDAIEEYWWRKRPGTWAKHLVKDKYELWFSFGKNRRGEYSGLTVNWSSKVKRIFFLGGLQGKGWWKLLVAVFELVNRPVKNPSCGARSGRKVKKPSIVKMGQLEKPWQLSFPCPHCNDLFHVSLEGGAPKSYTATLRLTEGVVK